MNSRIKIGIKVLCLSVLLASVSPAHPPPVHTGANPELYAAYQGLKAFGILDAWKMGYTGRGVNVAVMDSGIDFGTPDLYGTQARVQDPESPYFGWPIVVDIISLQSYQNRQESGLSMYCDTSSTDLEGWIPTGTSLSGVYRIGNHPDRNLTQYYGEPIKVLLADEHEAGVYDTVYVDLNNNRDFRDDKPCRLGDEISVWDRNGDGYWDETGGMIYFIADGTTPLPFSRMLYGDDVRIPENGSLVAFHFEIGSHGTMCAGTIGARGKRVWGLAPDVNLIPVFAYGSNDVTLALLAALGYDGKPGTGDEAQVISRSAGFDHVQKGGDEMSAALDHIATRVAPKTTLVYSAGNAGSGYGTHGSPAGEHIINVGAIQDLWWLGSPHRGDLVCFSSRGPDVFGRVKPNVLGTGFFAPQVVPLNRTRHGESSWDMNGGGTSNAAPHAAGVAALIYQAYKDTHGEFPDSATVRDIMMSSATDIREEVFAQGSGIINARRAVEIASGRGSVLVRPAYISSPPVQAGADLKFRLDITNYSGKPLSLHPRRLAMKSRHDFIVKAEDDELLIPIPGEYLDGHLVKVSSYSAKDTGTRNLEDTVGYMVYLYNWTDLNKDGVYGSGPRVTLETAQEGELVPLSISDWDHVITSEARIHNPEERIADGLVMGLSKECSVLPQHATMSSRDVTIVVEAFEWVEWDALRVELEDGVIAGKIRTPEETGVYQGKIVLQVEGNAKPQAIPIAFSTYLEGRIRLGTSNDIYENSRLYSRFEGSGRMGLRDARTYPILHRGHDLVKVKVTWEDPASEIDISLFGEGRVDMSEIWEFPQPPPVGLPMLSVFKNNGHSLKRVREVPCFPLELTTERTLIGVLQDGLNILVLNMLNSGQALYGENIAIDIEPIAGAVENPLKIEAEAGSSLTLNHEVINGMAGFREGVSITESAESREHVFHGRSGDIVVLRPQGPHFYSILYVVDEDAEKPDEHLDHVAFSIATRALMDRLRDEVIRLPFDGKYILRRFTGLIFHFGEADLRSGEVLSFTAPEKAGVHAGVPLNNGEILPFLVELAVSPGAAKGIHAEAKPMDREQESLEVILTVVDRFGNAVREDAAATVVFQANKQKVKLQDGQGRLVLPSPRQSGPSELTVRSRFGAETIRLEVAEVLEAGEAGADDGALMEIDKEDQPETPDADPEDKTRPEKITGVTMRMDGRTLKISWEAASGENFDHYAVYRLGGRGSSRKVGEVKVPEYEFETKPWYTYTFRIAAVNMSGNEGPLSDPAGIVSVEGKEK